MSGPMRRALVVGLDAYDHFPQLRCAVADARRIEALLARNDDGSVNYSTQLLVSGGGAPVTRAALRAQWLSLVHDFTGDVLFYFAGHGAVTAWGSYLVTQDGTPDEPGVSMDDLLVIANRCRARDLVIVLDCCHAGGLGNPNVLKGLEGPLALLREGVTVLAASRPDGQAYEAGGHGMFSDAVAEALEGGAADHMGVVNAASLFLYAERLFDAWAQRPIYKSHASVVSALRTCTPAVSPATLRQMRELFPAAEAELPLDPEYEADDVPEDTPRERARKVGDSRLLKRLRDARLVEPVGEEDLYWAAMRSKSARLTRLGRYFWRLVEGRLI